LAPEVAGTYANVGMSAATNALKLGTALLPLEGPARIRFFAFAP